MTHGRPDRRKPDATRAVRRCRCEHPGCQCFAAPREPICPACQRGRHTVRRGT